MHMLGDTHVYSNHVEPLKEQLKNEPYPFVKLNLTKDVKNIDDFEYKHMKIPVEKKDKPKNEPRNLYECVLHVKTHLFFSVANERHAVGAVYRVV